jgi:type 1 glutamine amidotransferase
MNHRHRICCLTLIAVAAVSAIAAEEENPAADGKPAEKIYGEWRIQIRPDRGPAYNRLIEREGLPLFREAGGRMVGWWTTVVGNLYEHTTIWEYDGMAAFERAIAMLGKDDRFARFAAARDPLLAGEESRFLKLAQGAERPSLPVSAAYVVHERHRVAMARQREYLDFAMGPGLATLKRHGFRPIGPWMTDVGNWSEITWLYCFDSLTERQARMAAFAAHPDSTAYSEKLSSFVDEIVTRVLTPAPFARQREAEETPAEATSLLPHCEQVAPGVFVAGFADRYASANCGWFTTGDETWLVDLPRGLPVADFLAVVGKTTKHPARQLVLTQWQSGDETIVKSLLKKGVTTVTTSAALAERLFATSDVPAAAVRSYDVRTPLGAGIPLELIPCDGAASWHGAALYLSTSGVLFAGPLVTHGPRAPLVDSNTALWRERLESCQSDDLAVVIPGRGSWGGPERLERQANFLSEIRRQVGYTIAQGRALPPLTTLKSALLADEVWMPYDGPTADDWNHVYRELTVPHAPFSGHTPTADDSATHALILIGDQPHEPGHIEEGLRPALRAANVVPHFAVDVRAMSAENLAHAQLLVILRDGLQRPLPNDGEPYVWMTDDQQRAVVEFVERGGGFLNLHNSMGLYPKDGPYLRLVGGAYTGHGPLERFRVEVLDREHPITRGVSAFTVADEQHTPIYDEAKVHLLLQSRSDEGKTAAAGWVREVGRGRVCHLAPGHTREALLHPMYQRLLRNAIGWCLKREVQE